MFQSCLTLVSFQVRLILTSEKVVPLDFHVNTFTELKEGINSFINQTSISIHSENYKDMNETLKPVKPSAH